MRVVTRDLPGYSLLRKIKPYKTECLVFGHSVPHAPSACMIVSSSKKNKMSFQDKIINSIVEKGEEKARQQAILSRRLAEEQLNNQQYIAKNPMTLMCT